MPNVINICLIIISAILRVFFTTAVSNEFSCANYSCSTSLRTSLRTSHPLPPRVVHDEYYTCPPNYLIATCFEFFLFEIIIIKGSDFLQLAFSTVSRKQQEIIFHTWESVHVTWFCCWFKAVSWTLIFKSTAFSRLHELQSALLLALLKSYCLS